MNSRPDHVIVDLLNDGHVIDTVSRPQRMAGSTPLKVCPKQTKTAKSINIPSPRERFLGYTSQITGDALIGFTITNKKNSTGGGGGGTGGGTDYILHYESNGGTE